MIRVAFEKLEARLRGGRPLVLDADTCASFRTRGTLLDLPGAVGRLLRSEPELVLEHYRAEVRSRVDVLTALTADTTPRALAEVGMQHRSARLTGLAVELAFEAAAESPRPIAVAGVLGSELVSALAEERNREELIEHAQRLATAGCELVIARGLGSLRSLVHAVAAASETGLPTWAVVECDRDTGALSEPTAALAERLLMAGATVVLFEVTRVEHARDRLDSLEDVCAGALLAASAGSLRGFDDALSARWVEEATRLEASGARVIGGGAGTTETHTAALSSALGAIHPSIPVSSLMGISG